MLTDRQKRGLQGERIAAAWLAQRGWTILQRRFRNGHRDIDLVAAQQQFPGPTRLVAFVEVRTRLSSTWGTPIETVRYRKQMELIQAAKAWMALYRCSGDSYRFDVVGIILGGERPEIEYVPDAFWRPRFG